MISGSKLIDYDDIRSHLIDEAHSIIQSCLQESHPSQRPLMIHMCGIPGAGKTTYRHKWFSESASADTFTAVQFDDVMEALSGYRRDRESLGIVQAFKLWELPARAVGYHLLQALIEGRRNVFFDHSATSRLHIDLIETVQRMGYLVEMHYIECAPEEAARRVKLREQMLHRHTPERLIFERHQLLQELLPQYQNCVDRFVQIRSE